MDFTFTEDQLAFRDTVQSMLDNEVTTPSIRARWESESGESESMLSTLNEMGMNALLVPESCGGLGMGLVDFVLLAEACGRAALPETVVEDNVVAVGLLSDLLEAGVNATQVEQLLGSIAEGAVRVGCTHMINPYSNFAHRKDFMLLANGNDIHLVPSSDLTFTAMKSVDPSRRLQKIDWSPSRKTRVADGELGAGLLRATINRGALAASAQLLGLAQAMVQQAVDYASTREQFGKAIGTNQAVKHLMADCAVQIEFARPAVYRAAYTVSVAPQRADWAVSHAKTAAGSSAELTARNATQVHGAMGYTWECDLHIWVKRAWALAREWGDAGFHKNRIHEWLLQPNALLGPEFTFGKRHIETTESAAA
jgi:alkylation response protein AidB-like acyl-CoA dehydrogenase